MIKVWSNKNCVQCDQTKRFLDKLGIAYLELSLADNPEDTQRFLDMGFRSAPVVETENDIWSGFKIDKLNKLAEESI